MLSQRVSKVALELRFPVPAKERARLHAELVKAIADWSSTHEALLRGEFDDALLFTRSSAVERQATAIDPVFRRLLAAAKQLSSRSDPDAWAVILQNEGQYLEAMDRIVSTFERESSERVEHLKRLQAGFLGVLFCVLASLGIFLFRPVQRRIHGDMNTIRAKNELLSRQAVDLEEVNRFGSAEAKLNEFV